MSHHPLSHGSRAGTRRRLRALAPLLAGCVAAGSLVSATAPAAVAAGSGKADAFRSLRNAPLKRDWMKGLDGRTPLSRLSILGTHDTLSIHGGYFAQTQEDLGDNAVTLTEQLDKGIRALDVRVRVTENEFFTIHHGAIYQNANFDDVLTKADDFLSRNQGETIVMRLKAECPIGTGGGATGCTNDPSNVSAGVIAAIFDRYAKKYGNRFYKPSVTRNSLASTPTLDQVRGKIVLGTFGVSDSTSSASYGVSGFHSNLADDWKPKDADTKWNGVKANIDRASADTGDSWYMTYTSATSNLAEPSPEQYAGGYVDDSGGVVSYVPGQNLMLMNYLNSNATRGRIGVVMSDFPGWALIQNIIDRNKDALVKGDHPALWTVNDGTRTYENTKYRKRCMVRGPEFDSSKAGGLVTQRECQSTPPSSHQWTAEEPNYDGRGHFWVKASNGKCLTVPYNNGTPPAAGTQLFWWECETRWFSGSQMWNIVPTPVEIAGTSRTAYAFINNWTGKCLAIDPATASVAGGKVTQDACPK
ncbi:phosphatidylinositol-specific phospholipase C domain-containing protein [Streptomyces sp. NPDC012888]|uniref:phosphatidylinositol-specific phospholipase C domain-containing protein n=1 Tax=Streptomyces sp. NPDC012888 TaxID=3364855 RepID=UPI0036A361BE